MFEPLYAAAAGDTAQVPWAKNQAHPYLQQWLQQHPFQTQGKSKIGFSNWLRFGRRCRITR